MAVTVNTPKRCPGCGSRMFVRVNLAEDRVYLCCTRWGSTNGCRHTEPAPPHLVLAVAVMGAPEPEGFAP